jgi:signal transduction histidine kinase
MDAKERAASAIEQAKAELDKALADIDMIQTVNPALVGLIAHALSNYITVTAATVEMLQLTLRGHQDPDVPIWLEGIGHATDLMQHSVGRLVRLATPRDFPLKLDYVNVALLMERACEYFRRRAGAERLQFTCRSVGPVPLAWGDRVALAVVADNLMSRAVRVSRPHGSVRVQVVAEPGHVVCSVADAGPPLTEDEQAALRQPILATAADAAEGDGNGDAQATLGLAIAHEFVRRMDGDLWGESNGKTGAIISFRLPALE